MRVNFTAADAGPAHLPLQGAGTARRAGHAEQQPRRARRGDRPREKVLYIEGEPRLRDEVHPAAPSRTTRTCRSSSCSAPPRTSTYRLDVGSPDELVGGFPKTREELFQYRALILGSVEAASFSPEQLRMLADFVSKRGGGLLMLGGRRSFAEGGWAGTPVAEVLPVEFDTEAAGRGNAPEYFSHLTVRPTRAGATFPVTQLAATEAGIERALERHADGHRGQRRAGGEARRHGAADRRDRGSRRSRSCSPSSATAAARRSRSRSRIRGSGRWTRRLPSTT